MSFSLYTERRREAIGASRVRKNMANMSEASGWIDIYPIKKGDRKAAEWFIEAFSHPYANYGMKTNDVIDAEEEYYYQLTFSGDGRWAFHYNLEEFNDWYIIPMGYTKNEWNNICLREHPHEYCLSNLKKVAIKQATKRIQKIVFNYYDFEEGEGFLVHEIVTLHFRDGLVEKLEDNDYEDIGCTAKNVMDYGFADFAYDCTVESLKSIDPEQIDLGTDFIFSTLNDRQWQALSDYLFNKSSCNCYTWFSDFWDDLSGHIHDWMDSSCLVDKKTGEAVSKLNNSILLLDGKEQMYTKKRQYTAKCVRDFFTIAEQGIAGPDREDILDLLRDMSDELPCVETFLRLGGPSF